MSQDIATLSVKVTDDGIKSTANSLERLEKFALRTAIATEKLAEISEESGRATDRLAKGMGKLEKATDGLYKKTLEAGAAFAAYFGARAATSYILQATKMAGAYDMLGVSMVQVGKNAGYSRSEMLQYEQSLRKAGIAALESRQTLSRMVSANIDLAKSHKLARGAQDVAVIGQINSSEAFQRLIYGIQSAQTEVLRTIGINVNFEKSYANMAKQLGVTIGELSEYARTVARTQAVEEELAKAQGTYEAAMTSAEKQMHSMTRYVKDYQVALGKATQPAYLKYVETQTELYKRLNEAVSDPAFQSALEGLSSGIMRIYSDFVTKHAANLPKYIEKATDALKKTEEVAGNAGKLLRPLVSMVNGIYSFWQMLPECLRDPLSGGLIGGILFGRVGVLVALGGQLINSIKNIGWAIEEIREGRLELGEFATMGSKALAEYRTSGESERRRQQQLAAKAFSAMSATDRMIHNANSFLKEGSDRMLQSLLTDSKNLNFWRDILNEAYEETAYEVAKITTEQLKKYAEAEVERRKQVKATTVALEESTKQAQAKAEEENAATKSREAALLKFHQSYIAVEKALARGGGETAKVTAQNTKLEMELRKARGENIDANWEIAAGIEKKIEVAKAEIATAQQAIKQYEALTKEERKNFKGNIDNARTVIKIYGPLINSLEKQIFLTDQIAEAQKRANAQAKEAARIAEQRKNFDGMMSSLEDRYAQASMNEEQLFERRQQLLLKSYDEEWKARKISAVQRERLYKEATRVHNAELKKRNEAERRQINELGQMYEKMLDSIRDMNAGTIRGLLDGNLREWKDYGKAILDIMKNTFAQVAATALQQRFVLPAIGIVTGGANAAAAAGLPGAGNVLAGGGQSWLSGLGGVGQTGGFWGQTIPGTAFETTANGMPAVGGATWGATAGAGALGAIGYSTLGKSLGMPQSKYSGMTAGLGGALGYAGGAALLGSATGTTVGAATGTVVPVVGTIAGAIVGGMIGSMFGKKKRDRAVAYAYWDKNSNERFVEKPNHWKSLGFWRYGNEYWQHGKEHGEEEEYRSNRLFSRFKVSRTPGERTYEYDGVLAPFYQTMELAKRYVNRGGGELSDDLQRLRIMKSGALEYQVNGKNVAKVGKDDWEQMAPKIFKNMVTSARWASEEVNRAMKRLDFSTLENAVKDLNTVLSHDDTLRGYTSGIIEQQNAIKTAAKEQADTVLKQLDEYKRKSAHFGFDIEKVSAAQKEYVKQLVLGRSAMTETEKAAYEVKARFEEMKRVLVDVGWSADEAARIAQQGMEKALQNLKGAVGVTSIEAARELEQYRQVEKAYYRSIGKEGKALALERQDEIKRYQNLAREMGLAGNALQDFIKKVSSLTSVSSGVTRMVGSAWDDYNLRHAQARGDETAILKMQRTKEANQAAKLGADINDFVTDSLRMDKERAENTIMNAQKHIGSLKQEMREIEAAARPSATGLIDKLLDASGMDRERAKTIGVYDRWVEYAQQHGDEATLTRWKERNGKISAAGWEKEVNRSLKSDFAAANEKIKDLLSSADKWNKEIELAEAEKKNITSEIAKLESLDTDFTSRLEEIWAAEDARKKTMTLAQGQMSVDKFNGVNSDWKTVFAAQGINIDGLSEVMEANIKLSESHKKLAALYSDGTITATQFQTALGILTTQMGEGAQKLSQSYESAKRNYLDALRREQEKLESEHAAARSAYVAKLNEEAQAQQRVIAATEQAGKSLSAFRESLFVDANSPENAIARYDLLADSVQALTQKVLAGDWDKTGQLVSTGSSYLAASKETHADWRDYDRDVAMLAISSKTLEDRAGQQKSIAEKQLAGIQSQIDGINGIETKVVSLDEARSNYETAKSLLDNSWYLNEIEKIEGVSQQLLSLQDARAEYESAKAAFDSKWMQTQTQSLNGLLESNKGLETLQKATIAAIKCSWPGRAQRGYALKERSDRMSKAPGYRDGGISTGPESGYHTLLHGTEAIIPLGRGVLPLEIRGLPRGGDGAEMLDLVKELRAEIRQLREDQCDLSAQVVKNTAQTAHYAEKEFVRKGCEVAEAG